MERPLLICHIIFRLDVGGLENGLVNLINRLTPAEVYQALKVQHPRTETRRYLIKVLEARRDFVKS